jgi:hypothetical protein
MTSRGPIVAMSFRPSIPWRVALQQSPPPLAQPGSCCAEHFRLSSKTQRTATWDFARVSRKGFTPECWVKWEKYLSPPGTAGFSRRH